MGDYEGGHSHPARGIISMFLLSLLLICIVLVSCVVVIGHLAFDVAIERAGTLEVAGYSSVAI